MSIQVGDRVEVKIVGNVTAKDGKFLVLDSDVYLHSDTRGLNFRKLPRPKPQVGDVLTGAEIAEVRWKRGSMVSLRGYSPSVFGLILHEDGKWHTLSEPFASYGFSASDRTEHDSGRLSPTALFDILYVA